jgi:SAM-dependent methyltransferase
MSAVGELVLKSIVSLRTRRANGHANEHPSEDDFAAYIQWQYESSPKLFAKYPASFDVRGKTVLEIGCGTGGRTAYLASLGAAKTVGIDINRDEIAIAQREVKRLYPHLDVQYRASTESDRLDIGKFDVVVLIDCLEHVVSPPNMVKLAHEYTADGGRCFISLYGWYNANGSHFGMMPFVNVFFSDEEILNVQRWMVSRPGYVPSRFDSSPPVERWQGLYDLRQRPGEYLNKITLREMKKLVKYTPFSRGEMHVIGFERANPLVKALNTLRHVPIVQEALHSYVVLEFER